MFAKLAPLRQVVRSAVEDVDLAICAVGAHDVLLDGLANLDELDEVIERRLRSCPVGRGDNFDDARLHAIAVDLVHL